MPATAPPSASASSELCDSAVFLPGATASQSSYTLLSSSLAHTPTFSEMTPASSSVRADSRSGGRRRRRRRRPGGPAGRGRRGRAPARARRQPAGAPHARGDQEGALPGLRRALPLGRHPRGRAGLPRVLAGDRPHPAGHVGGVVAQPVVQLDPPAPFVHELVVEVAEKNQVFEVRRTLRPWDHVVAFDVAHGPAKRTAPIAPHDLSPQPLGDVPRGAPDTHGLSFGVVQHHLQSRVPRDPLDDLGMDRPGPLDLGPT